jgi:hypothetical protein
MGFSDAIEAATSWLLQRVPTPLRKRERLKDQHEPLNLQPAKRSRSANGHYVVAVNGQQRVISDPSRQEMNDEITKIYKRKAKHQEHSPAALTSAPVCSERIMGCSLNIYMVAFTMPDPSPTRNVYKVQCSD